MTVDVYVSVEPARIRRSQKTYHYRIVASAGEVSGSGETFATLHGATLEGILAALSRFTRSATVRISVRDTFVEAQIRQLDAIQGRGFLRVSGKQMANRELWERLAEYKRAHKLEAVRWQKT